VKFIHLLIYRNETRLSVSASFKNRTNNC